MKHLILFLSLLLSITLYSQNHKSYFYLSSKHWQYYNQGKTDSILQIVKTIENNYHLFPPDIPVFLKTCLLNDDVDITQKMVIELLTKTDFDTSKFAHDAIFQKIYSLPFWNQINESYDSLRNVYYKNLNVKMICQLNAMRELDQYGRLNYPDSLISVYHLPKEIDTYNFIKLKKLIEEKGFPPYSAVGKSGFKSIYIVLMHNSTYGNNLNYIDSVMKQQMIIGNWEPWRYANIIDRYYHFMKGYQVYGTFITKNNKGERTCGKITDVQNLDKRRKEIGLSPFMEYAKYMKIKDIPGKYTKNFIK